MSKPRLILPGFSSKRGGCGWEDGSGSDGLNISVSGNFMLCVFLTAASPGSGFPKRSLNEVKSKFGPSCKILEILKKKIKIIIWQKGSPADVCASSGNG